jgi:hypothetical protein
MNKTSFYKGLLAELTKLTKLSELAKEPSKKHWYQNPYVLGGLGIGAGALGTYGLNRYFDNPATSPTQSITTSTPTTPTTPAPTSFNSLNNGIATGVGAGLGGLAVKKWGLNGVSGGVDALSGINNIYDSVSNPDNLSPGLRAVQGVGGASQAVLGGLGLAGKSVPMGGFGSLGRSVSMRPITNLASKLLPSALRSTAPAIQSFLPGFAAPRAMTAAAGSVAAVPLSGGAAVQALLNEGGDKAQQHSDLLGSVADSLVGTKNNPGIRQELRSGDPALINDAKQRLNSFFSSGSNNLVTSPGTLANIGYNPTPWSNKGNTENFQTIAHLLEQVRREAELTK